MGSLRPWVPGQVDHLCSATLEEPWRGGGGSKSSTRGNSSGLRLKGLGVYGFRGLGGSALGFRCLGFRVISTPNGVTPIITLLITDLLSPLRLQVTLIEPL